APPHALLIPAVSLSVAFWSAGAVFVSVAQTVAPGSLPFSLFSSHFFRAFMRACANFPDSFTMPRWHLTGSACARVATATNARSENEQTTMFLTASLMTWSSSKALGGTTPDTRTARELRHQVEVCAKAALSVNGKRPGSTEKCPDGLHLTQRVRY